MKSNIMAFKTMEPAPTCRTRNKIILFLVFVFLVTSLPIFTLAYNYSDTLYTYGTDGMLNIRSAAGGGSVLFEVPNGTQVKADSGARQNNYVPVQISICANTSLVGQTGWAYINYLSASSLNYSTTLYANGTDGSLNMRNAPIRSSVITSYPNGTEVEADLSQKYSDYVPVKIKSTGEIGWMYYPYLAQKSPYLEPVSSRSISPAMANNSLVKIKMISFEQNLIKLNAGTCVNLVASITPGNASNKALKWTTSNPKIATVNQQGMVTTVSTSGSCWITVSSTDGSSVTADCLVQIISSSNPKNPESSAPSKNESTKITIKAINNVLEEYGYKSKKYWSYNYTVKGAENSYKASSHKATTNTSTKRDKAGDADYKGYYFDQASECHGFAKFMGYKLTGVIPGKKGWTKFTNVDSIAKAGGLRIGDIIRTSGHTAMIYSISSSGRIYVIECWGGSNNQLNINGNFNGSRNNATWEQIIKNNTFEYLWRYTG